MGRTAALGALALLASLASCTNFTTDEDEKPTPQPPPTKEDTDERAATAPASPDASVSTLPTDAGASCANGAHCALTGACVDTCGACAGNTLECARCPLRGARSATCSATLPDPAVGGPACPSETACPCAGADDCPGATQVCVNGKCVGCGATATLELTCQSGRICGDAGRCN